MQRNVLLIIDPQEDFCEPENGRGGALAVPGGREALKRIAKFITKMGSKLDEIIITMDCHNPMHIAHPIWFVDENGNHPAPFTTIVEDNGEMLHGTLGANGFTPQGKIRCRSLNFTNWTLNYLRILKNGGRYPHMIWPPHCIIGEPGGCIIPEVAKAARNWEEKEFAIASRISKGSNFKTEHFGALRAEVIDPGDPSTQVNTDFLALLEDPNSTIYGCGLALGHCLANTARDTAKEFDGDTFCQRFVLLRDGTEHVAGLEFLGDSFIKDFEARGMRIANTTDF